MLRHATAVAARSAGWSEAEIGRLVLGHAEPKNAGDHQPVGRERFAYVPLPSLEPRHRGMPAQHVGMIRRAMIYVPAGTQTARVIALRRLLAGCELVSEQDESQALITTLPTSNAIVRRYVPSQPSHVWATVTPVVLPGRDDRRQKKTESLLRKAIRQAGYTDELAEHAEFDWRPAGYWPGAERADRYFAPRHLRTYPAHHVRIRWHDSSGQPLRVPGPIVLGGGRYCGLGLFAAEDEGDAGV